MEEQKIKSTLNQYFIMKVIRALHLYNLAIRVLLAAR